MKGRHEKRQREKGRDEKRIKTEKKKGAREEEDKYKTSEKPFKQVTVYQVLFLLIKLPCSTG